MVQGLSPLSSPPGAHFLQQDSMAFPNSANYLSTWAHGGHFSLNQYNPLQTCCSSYLRMPFLDHIYNKSNDVGLPAVAASILRHTVFKVAVSGQQLSSLRALSQGPLVVNHAQSAASSVIVEKKKVSNVPMMVIFHQAEPSYPPHSASRETGEQHLALFPGGTRIWDERLSDLNGFSAY